MANNKIVFIGTGEACDRKRKNTSILVKRGDSATLLDCGFNSAQGCFHLESPPLIKTIWLSHLHGDHFFGIPHLILHFHQQQRRQPLTFITGFQCAEAVTSLIGSAYPNLLEKLTFQLHFTTISCDDVLLHDSMTWRCAKSIHSQQAFSLQLQLEDTLIYYSGDGNPTSKGEELLSKSHIVIHEAFSYASTDPSHCSIEKCLALAKKYTTPTLALVHLNNETRKLQESGSFHLVENTKTTILFPNDGDYISLDK